MGNRNRKINDYFKDTLKKQDDEWLNSYKNNYHKFTSMECLKSDKHFMGLLKDAENKKARAELLGMILKSLAL